jgi:hypothetical protein
MGNVKSNYVNRCQSGSSSIPLMMHTTWSPANKIGMKTFHLFKDESGMRKNDGSINYPNKLFFPIGSYSECFIDVIRIQ